MNARWASWRRDLLFALAGALVASAVLVPVGWSQLRAERQRAEAAEAEAARVEQLRVEQERAAKIQSFFGPLLYDLERHDATISNR
jgi:uncharacterized membrane protein